MGSVLWLLPLCSALPQVGAAAVARLGRPDPSAPPGPAQWPGWGSPSLGLLVPIVAAAAVLSAVLLCLPKIPKIRRRKQPIEERVLGDFKRFGKQIRIARDVIELKACLASSWCGGIHDG